MSYQEFSCYFLLGGIAVFQMGRIYERWSAKRYSRAAEIIKSKYQSHLSRTSSPARTSKQ